MTLATPSAKPNRSPLYRYLSLSLRLLITPTLSTRNQEEARVDLSESKGTTNTEFAVVTVDTTGDQDIYDYSLAVYRGWGIGTKTNDGFLLLLAVKDRKYYTQVGYHLEGDLNDGPVGQIQRERLVPQLRQGNYSKGIYDTVQGYVATLAEKRGFTIEGIDQRYAYREPRTQPGERPDIGSRSGGLSRSAARY